MKVNIFLNLVKIYKSNKLIQLLLFVPAISVSVRRLHDIDKSGWFVFISVIPFIGWVILAIMLIGKGTEKKNQFGEYPLSLIKK